jgi:hypothetical protein
VNKKNESNRINKLDLNGKLVNRCNENRKNIQKIIKEVRFKLIADS